MAVLPPGNILQYMYIVERIKRQKNIKTFLEVGSGNGFLSHELLKLKMNGIGCDLNESACANNKNLNKKFLDSNCYQIFNEDFLSKNFDQKFDLIISSMVIEHLEENELDNFFLKFKEILDPNGKIILLVPSSMKHWGIEDEIAGHVKRYERNDFMELAFKWNLEIVDIAGLTYPISNWLFNLSNRLISKSEKSVKALSMKDRTIYTGNREVKYKTQFPAYFKIILNKLTLYPFHILQKIFKSNKNSLVLYCELKYK